MEQEPHLSGTKARAGSSEHVVRYVLGISLVAVIVLFIAIYLLGKEAHALICNFIFQQPRGFLLFYGLTPSDRPLASCALSATND